MITEELTDYGKLAYDKTQDMERERLNINQNLFSTIETLCFKTTSFSINFYSEINEIIHIKLEHSYENNTGEIIVKLNNKLLSKYAMQNEINLYFMADLNNCIEVVNTNESFTHTYVTCVGKLQLFEKNNYKFMKDISTNKIHAYNEQSKSIITYNDAESCANNNMFSGTEVVETGFNNFTNDFVEDIYWKVSKLLKVINTNNRIKINTLNNVNIALLEYETMPTIVIGIPNITYRFMQFRLNNNDLEVRYILHDKSTTDYTKISFRLNLKIKNIIPICKLDSYGSIPEVLIQTTNNEIYYLFGNVNLYDSKYRFNDFLIKIDNGRSVNCYGKDNKLYFFIEQNGSLIKLVYLLNNQKLFRIERLVIQNYIGGFITNEDTFFYNEKVIAKIPYEEVS